MCPSRHRRRARDTGIDGEVDLPRFDTAPVRGGATASPPGCLGPHESTSGSVSARPPPVRQRPPQPFQRPVPEASQPERRPPQLDRPHTEDNQRLLPALHTPYEPRMFELRISSNVSSTGAPPKWTTASHRPDLGEIRKLAPDDRLAAFRGSHVDPVGHHELPGNVSEVLSQVSAKISAGAGEQHSSPSVDHPALRYDACGPTIRPNLTSW